MLVVVALRGDDVGSPDKLGERAAGVARTIEGVAEDTLGGSTVAPPPNQDDSVDDRDAGRAHFAAYVADPPLTGRLIQLKAMTATVTTAETVTDAVKTR